MNNYKIKKTLFAILSITVLVIIDQLTKMWAVIRLKDSEPIVLIKNTLEFYYLPNGNTGAAFGMLKGHQILFLIIALIISMLLLFLIYNMPNDKKFTIINVVLTLIIAGGIGNMIDRIRLNYVVDFIYFCLIDFPIFNVADMYVSIGTAVLVILLLFYYKEKDLVLIEENIKSIFKKKA